MKNYLKVIPNRYKQLSKEEKTPFIIVMIICCTFGILIGLGVSFLIGFLL